MNFYQERNKQIIEAMLLGKTQTEIAREYSISRERARQIFNKYRGISYSELHTTLRFEKKKAAEHKLRSTVKFTCLLCTTPVYFPTSKTKFCGPCWEKTKNSRRDTDHKVVCFQCGISFFPLSTIKYQPDKNAGKYCSSQCYWIERRSHVKETITRIRSRHRYAEIKIKRLEKKLETMIHLLAVKNAS